jgi:hypothetical protein
MSSDDANLEAYRQANGDLRHYSILRFTILGSFAAISGGLFVFAGKNAGPNLPVLAIFATAMALVFGTLEWRINAISEFYAKKIDDLAKELGMSLTACGAPPKSALREWLMPGIMYVICGGSTIMWMYAWWLAERPTRP